MADDFVTGAELEVTVSQSSLRDARRKIESELGDITVEVAAEVSGGGGMQPRDPETGRFMAIEGVEQRLVDQNTVLADLISIGETQVGLLEGLTDAQTALGEGDSRSDRRRRREFRWAREQLTLSEERNEILLAMNEDIEDLIGEAGGGGGGGTLGGLARGLGMGVGGGLGLTALGIGTGVGIGALGIGAGAGLATGNIQLPEDFSINLDRSIEVGDVNPVIDLDESQINFPDVNLASPQIEVHPELNPTFDLAFDPQLDFAPVLEPTFAPEFDPVFEPEFSPTFSPEFSPVFEPEFNIDTDLRANINANPSFTFSPTVNLTGVDLGGLADDVESAIVNSRQFQNEVEGMARSVVDDLVTAINRQTGLNITL